MGLFDWIGEAIGGAFNALAEFIGDSFKGVFSGLGKSAVGVARDMYSDVGSETVDPTSSIAKSAGQLHKKAIEPIEKGWLHSLEESSKHHSEIPIENIEKEVMDLWDKIRVDDAAATLGAIIAECASLGQVEGAFDSYRSADKISGGTSFAAEVQAMRLRSLYLVMYQRYLNQANPMRLPGASDIVRFGLREVWEPTRREELLREQAPTLFYKFMGESGYNTERAADYWASHWDLPSLGQLNEMLHRGVIDLDTWDRFVKYLDYDPTVRPWLRAISYNPYTRVDIRRMADLGLVTDTEVFQNYKDLGYDDEHARLMTIWTKAYNLSVDLRARYSKGWITPTDMLNELTNAGVPPARAKRWTERIVTADKEARTSTERDLTKSEIVKGVKEGVLSYEDGLAMLQDLGYDEYEAEYILVVNVAAITGSPTTWGEFQTMVNLRRKSQGLKVKEIPQEILDIEEEITRLGVDRDQIFKENPKSKKIPGINKKIESLNKKHRELVERWKGIG